MSSNATAVKLPRLMTAQEVADQTGIPKSSVYELSRTGKLPALRFGRALRYNPAVLAQFLGVEISTD